MVEGFFGPRACPKCGGFIRFEQEERHCFNCGWEPTYAPIGTEETTTYTNQLGTVVERKKRSKRIRPDSPVNQLSHVSDGDPWRCQTKIKTSSRMMKRCEDSIQFEVTIQNYKAKVCAKHLHYWERRYQVTIIKEVTNGAQHS